MTKENNKIIKVHNKKNLIVNNKIKLKRIVHKKIAKYKYKNNNNSNKNKMYNKQINLMI